MEMTDLALILYEEKFADSLTKMKSLSSPNIALQTSQWRHPIQQWGTQEELHHDSTVMKGDCRDMN